MENLDASFETWDATFGNPDATPGNPDAALQNLDTTKGNPVASAENPDASSQNLDAALGNPNAICENPNDSPGNNKTFKESFYKSIEIARAEGNVCDIQNFHDRRRSVRRLHGEDGQRTHPKLTPSKTSHRPGRPALARL